ncbi:Zn-ribbon domain-containing OB-fold protein [Nocardioides humi]|uniref:ChsH2 C-terminal OB-fold domain-containing protein n=1 Tax=Nocardioides humi TaxID=449461 RepID=A0ABN2A6S9_9ACTN|nr:OB-fold domain-containing protein [Nocardioides humi]
MTRREIDPTEYQPSLTATGVAGGRCLSCGRATAPATHRCPWCGAVVEFADFAPRGVVWASTVVHLDSAGRAVPRALAYVDLDDGPRVLVSQAEAVVWPVGTPVTLGAATVAADWALAHRGRR